MDTCVGWSVCNRVCNCFVLSCLVWSLHFTSLHLLVQMCQCTVFYLLQHSSRHQHLHTLRFLLDAGAGADLRVAVSKRLSIDTFVRVSVVKWSEVTRQDNYKCDCAHSIIHMCPLNNILVLTITFKSIDAPTSSRNMSECRWLYLLRGLPILVWSPRYSHLHRIRFPFEAGASIDLKVAVSKRLRIDTFVRVSVV